MFPRFYPIDLETLSKPDSVENMFVKFQGKIEPGNLEGLRKNWNTFVGIYTSGSLTKNRDSPVAISGVARMLAHEAGLADDKYVAGLWMPEL